ncbi:MAG: DUF3363 domain-containing protein [Hyphomicrobiales bacterium]
MNDDDFEPKLPKRKAKQAARKSNYIQKVLRSARKRHNKKSHNLSSRKHTFTGSRIGRGRAAGALAVNSQFNQKQRRVVVRARIAKFGSGQLTSARAHLSYIQRGGVTKEGEKGQLYDAVSDEVDGKSFLETCKGDRHQFRFIVSPEDGHKLEDLKPFVRDLMQQAEYDLETKLDWVAVDHFDTGYPHTHVVVRGKDDRGDNLVIARDYISHGLRHRAENLITLELGPQTQYELETKLNHEIKLERFTRLDQEILKLSQNNQFQPLDYKAGLHERGQFYLRRLKVLEQLGLAHQVTNQGWTLAPTLKPVLQNLGNRSDVMALIQKDLRTLRLNRSSNEVRVIESKKTHNHVIGKVLKHGLVDELKEQSYVLIDGVDGYVHYANIGVLKDIELPDPGMIIELFSRSGKTKTIDNTIHEIASQNDGVYSVEHHQIFDRNASKEFIKTHGRRLETLLKKGLVERTQNGNWNVGQDYLEKVKKYEQAIIGQQPLSLTVRSYLPLDQLPSYVGPTWLDHMISKHDDMALSNVHFGKNVMSALNDRQTWLVEQGYGKFKNDKFIPKPAFMKTLTQHELHKTGTVLSKELNFNFVETKIGQKIEGIYKHPVQLALNKYAMIERGPDISLVPWRPVLERAKGRVVSGIMRPHGVSWDITQKRGIGLG